jgi:hypothetical protein
MYVLALPSHKYFSPRPSLLLLLPSNTYIVNNPNIYTAFQHYLLGSVVMSVSPEHESAPMIRTYSFLTDSLLT